MTDDTGQSLSDVEKALKQVGIELFETKGQFRDMDSILGELAKKWSSLNDVEQSSIAASVAGVRQRNLFISLMKNWNKSLYLSAVAINSEGQAAKKNEVYLDSYEAKLNKLKSTFDEFITTATDSSAFKGILDGLSGILGFLNKIGGFQAVLTLLLGVLTAAKGGKLASILTDRAASSVQGAKGFFANVIGKTTKYQRIQSQLGIIDSGLVQGEKILVALPEVLFALWRAQI